MAAKTILVFCAQALLAQTVFSQCYGRSGPPLKSPFPCGGPVAAPACCYAIDITPTSGGTFPISSTSSIPPNGISITSENIYQGLLTVVGELPFLGTVSLDGLVPSAGVGSVNHACGNGRTAIAHELIGSTTPAALAPGYDPTAAIIAHTAAFGPDVAASIARGCGSIGAGFY